MPIRTKITSDHSHNFSVNGGSVLVCWLVSVNLTQTKVSLEERILIKELPPSYWPVGMSLGHFLNCYLVQESLAWMMVTLWAGRPGLYKKGT